MNTTTMIEKTKQNISIFKQKFVLNQRIIYTVFFYMSIVFSVAMAYYWHTTTNKLNAQASSLSLVSSYGMDSLYNNENIKEVAPFWKNIDDVLKFNTQLTNTIAANENHRTSLSLPFNNFLNLFYTPSLNIWRDPFKQTIDTNLIGDKYLKWNPYGDIALMEKWTDFFKDVGISDGYNKINNINIGSIEPTPQAWYFSITINVDFESPDKRSFLLLVNKLSMTAYLENLWLINEFIFHVWNNIKDEKKELLTNAQTQLKDTLPYVAEDQDRLIGYLLYDWVNGEGENVLVSNGIMNKSIRQTAWCIDESQSQCNYLFRQKMRNIPYLAYGVARDGINPIEWFRAFFQYIPPILSIEQFSFEEMKKTRWSNGAWYRGTIAIKVYGKDIMANEINTISNELWLMCFASKESMGSLNAKIRVEKNINELWIQSFDTRRSIMLSQILEAVNKVEESYETLPNHKKVVKLFELYRTLKENSLCDIIEDEIQEPINPILTWDLEILTGDIEEFPDSEELLDEEWLSWTELPDNWWQEVAGTGDTTDLLSWSTDNTVQDDMIDWPTDNDNGWDNGSWVVEDNSIQEEIDTPKNRPVNELEWWE